jgi:hypothetical protein
LGGKCHLVQESLEPGDESRLRPVLVKLQEEVRGPLEDFFDVLDREGIRSAPEIGKDERKDGRVLSAPKRRPDDLLIIPPDRAGFPSAKRVTIGWNKIDRQGEDFQLLKMFAEVQIEEGIMNVIGLSENSPELEAFTHELAEHLLPPDPQLPAKIFLGFLGFKVSRFERIVILGQDSLNGAQ